MVYCGDDGIDYVVCLFQSVQFVVGVYVELVVWNNEIFVCIIIDVCGWVCFVGFLIWGEGVMVLCLLMVYGLDNDFVMFDLQRLFVDLFG